MTSKTYYRYHYEGIDKEGNVIHGYSDKFENFHERRTFQRKGLDEFMRRDELWESDIAELTSTTLYQFRQINDNDVLPE